MIKRTTFSVCVIILFSGLVLLVQSCCGWGDGNDPPYIVNTIYKYQIELADTMSHFKRVTYSNSSIVQQSDTNFLEWKIFLRPPQTTMYVETEKGWDTLVYEVKQSKPIYENNCKVYETVKMSVSDPVILTHTFDSASIVERTAYNQPRSNDILVTVILKLKN